MFSGQKKCHEHKTKFMQTRHFIIITAKKNSFKCENSMRRQLASLK
jgi:hypothetical protein